MLQTQLVIHAPDRPCGTPEVTEFLLAVQRCRVYNDVVMDMVLIYVGADDKGVIALCQFQRQFLPDPVRFFRGNFSRLKCLPEMVGDHIIRTPVTSGQVCILPLGKKKLRIGSPSVARISINKFSVICLLRIFHIVDNICYGRGNIPAFSYM